MAGNLSEYTETLFGRLDADLEPLIERSLAQGIPAIQVPDELARLLQVLIVQTGAHEILEIGTLFGYSAIAMGRVMPENGRLVTLEANPLHASIARSNLESVGLASRVEVREGLASEILGTFAPGSFDFVFIDADKENYPVYLRHALELTHVGGTIVADNLWRDGVAAHPGPGDVQGRAIAEFNARLAAEPRLLTAILPTRNGRDAASVSVVISR